MLKSIIFLSFYIGKFSLLTWEMIFIGIRQVVGYPFPNVNIRTRIDWVNIFHIQWVIKTDYFISVNLESDGDITFDREQIIHVNDVVLSCSKEKSIVWREFYVGYIGWMSVFVLFY